MSSKLLKVPEAQEVTGFGRTTMYGLIASGELPVLRVGRAVRIPADALERWIQERTTGGVTPESELVRG